MSTEFWLGIVLGALAGKYLPPLLESMVRAGFVSWARRLFRATSFSAETSFVTGFYARRGRVADLHLAQLGGPWSVPFLTTPGLMRVKEGVTRADLRRILSVRPAPASWSSRTRKAYVQIARRRMAGKRVVDLPVLRLASIDDTRVPPAIVGGPGTYLQCASTWFRLESETARCASSSRLRSRTGPRFRKAHYDGFDAAARSSAPKQIGVGVALLVEQTDPRDPLVLVQRTAQEVAAARTDVFTLVPFFSSAPTPASSAWSTLELNVLREIGGELLGLEELEQLQESRRADPVWYLRDPLVAPFARALTSGSAEVTYLGSGFEACNGTFEIHLAISFAASSEVATKLNDVVGNWEIAVSADGTHLQLVALRSPTWQALLREGRLSTGPIVALDQLQRVRV